MTINARKYRVTLTRTTVEEAEVTFYLPIPYPDDISITEIAASHVPSVGGWKVVGTGLRHSDLSTTNCTITEELA